MEQQSNNNHNNKENKVFVGGLPHGTTDEEFETYFGQFGTIKDIVIIYDKETSKCRGFGFVTFENEESFNAVVQNRFHKLKDKLVEVKKALPKEAKNNIASTNYRTVPQLANPNYSGLATSTHCPYYNHHVYSQHSQQHNHYGNYALNGHNRPCDNHPLNGYVNTYICSDYYNYPLNSGSGPVYANGYASSSNVWTVSAGNNPNPVQSTRPNYGEAMININGLTNPARRNSNPVRISRPNGEPITDEYYSGRANPSGSDPNPIRITRTDGDASEGKENILETN